MVFRALQIKKIVLAIFGVTAAIVGWGMWMEPHLDFDILISLIADEILRLIRDPFAILGFMIMLLGLWVFFKAIIEYQETKGIFNFDKEHERF
jgi:hypothetical protein